ncbi:MAG: ribonuclease P protein component [Planctomycetes bacterium]|nr:ribonuclease P protein component [Planctomycetota bacterium]
MKTFSLSKSQRIRSNRDFSGIYELNQRAGDQHLLIFAAVNKLSTTRFGLSVSKRHGNAVRRMRLKRLLREAFRLTQHELPIGLDLILIPRIHCGAGLSDYQNSLLRLSRKLAKRLSIEESR